MSSSEISTTYSINTEEYEIELTIKGYYRCFCDFDINKLPSSDTMYELYGKCYNKAIWNNIYNELYKKFLQSL